MRLRNRVTGAVVYDTLTSSSLRSTLFPRKKENVEFLQAFLKDLETSLFNNLNHKDKVVARDLIKHLHANHFDEIKKIAKQFADLQAPPKRAHAVKPVTDDSLLGLLKTLGSSMLGAKFGVLGIIAASLPAAAAEAIYTARSGVPAGGSSLCIAIVGCLEGYLTKINATTWMRSDPQVQRTVTQAPGGSIDPVAFETLRSCMDFTKVSEALTESISSTSGELVTCSAQSTPWKNYLMTSLATNLNPESCTAYKNAFEAKAQTCMNSGVYYSSIATITGIAVGSVVGALCLAGLAYYCYTRYEHRSEAKAEAKTEAQVHSASPGAVV